MAVFKDNTGKREQILEAAIRVFAKKGFYNSKVEEIAVEANVGKGTVYEYFSSKQDLFQEMLKYIHDLYYQNFEKGFFENWTLKERLDYIFRFHIKFISDHKDMAKVLLSEQPRLDTGFRKWLKNMEIEKLNRLHVYIQEAVANKEIKELDTLLVTRIISGVIASVGGNIILFEEDLSPSEISNLSLEAINILYNGIAR